VTGPILADAMYITIQKEVADRIIAKPNSRDYGILSILLNAVGQPRIIRVLKPTVFWPQPQVDSAMVEFIRKQEKLKRIKNLDLFIETVNLFMGHRRKTLIACSKLATGKLAKIDDIRNISWPEIFNQCDIVPTKRPEQLSSEDYINIANLCHSALAKV
jgi:16S rRNA (adenine1518-N6/adenine1519-N6)-dimethyltransferase